MGFVKNAIEGVGEIVEDVVIDPVKSIGREVDDFVNDEVPGGWLGAAGLAAGGLAASGALAHKVQC